MSGAVTKLARPALRGHHLNEIKRNVGIATVGASVVSFAWYWFINKARRDNYANFYKNYDAEAEFQRMKAAGVFNCVKQIEEAQGDGDEE